MKKGESVLPSPLNFLSLLSEWLAPNRQLSSFRASCRIRTNDPEITNHVLWPTELKRRVGKLTTSRRYNQVPLLRSSPGGIPRELAV